MSEPLAYFLTFSTYASRLHGDERGSVERMRDGTGTRALGVDSGRVAKESLAANSSAAVLDEHRRRVVATTIEEVGLFKRWTIHALNVRSNHVHAVVSGDAKPEVMMNAFKSWATRRLREAGLAKPDEKLWTRHGSTRYLWDEDSVVAAGRYTLEGQGDDLGGVRWLDELVLERNLRGTSHPRLPDGRISDFGDA